MVSILMAALKSIMMKLLGAVAAEALLEWMIFKAAEVLVTKTTTKFDDEWLTKFKEAYYKGK